MAFKLFVEPEVLDDIQQAVDWYNTQKKDWENVFSMPFGKHLIR